MRESRAKRVFRSGERLSEIATRGCHYGKLGDPFNTLAIAGEVLVLIRGPATSCSMSSVTSSVEMGNLNETVLLAKK